MNLSPDAESPNRVQMRNTLLRAYHKARLLAWSFFHLPSRVMIGKVRVGTRNWRVANFCRSAEIEKGELRYERIETALFIEAAKGKRCFFDIGAHIGYYSFRAASEGVPRVFAFEVMEGLCGVMRRVTCANGLEKVIEVVQTAVGVRGRHIRFSEPLEEAAIETVSLDDFCGVRGLSPDLIKIDVEGFEYEVLVGAEKTLREYHPDLMVSLHEKFLRNRGSSSAAVLELLAMYGYREIRMITSDTCFARAAREGL